LCFVIVERKEIRTKMSIHREYDDWPLKVVVLPTFTFGTKIWVGGLEKLALEGFGEGHEDGDNYVSRQSTFFDNVSNFVGWIGELRVGLY
jgi:hypothetical protein